MVYVGESVKETKFLFGMFDGFQRTHHRRFCKFLWQKNNMTIFKSGEENIMANFQSEMSINYYKRQIWILALI
ncbi:hypothetical protein EPI10_006928 [Gossypium australe]|uniref:Uncharacterized protein n=1 Tax=Gossypium australe TaxID=47621 RepID=A0A5B6WUW5_9ROSI|nr:hypothetical protein EPI10_006928 [Gossypium australe]